LLCLGSLGFAINAKEMIMNRVTDETLRATARVPRLLSRSVRTALRVSLLAGLVLAGGCDQEAEDPVAASAWALRNNGRTPEQKKCDEKWQNCYVDCSVRYPESNDALDEDRRQGCFDSCDALHDLCAPARTTGVGATQTGAVLDATATTSSVTPGASIDTANAAALRAAAAAKSCTASSDGGMWCCVPISTPPYLQCTYTPPPDTIWTLTAQAALAR
jgi:hypothetical protein